MGAYRRTKKLNEKRKERWRGKPKRDTRLKEKGEKIRNGQVLKNSHFTAANSAQMQPR